MAVTRALPGRVKVIESDAGTALRDFRILRLDALLNFSLSADFLAGVQLPRAEPMTNVFAFGLTLSFS